MVAPTGTNFGAGRLLTSGHALAAHDALADARNRLLPLILGHPERASCHAIAATHAHALVVSHRAQGGLLQRSHRTDRSARRIIAVHAQLAHELVVLGNDGGELVGRGIFLGSNLVVVGQAVFRGACLLALPAADAFGRIVEDSFAHELSPGSVGAGGERRSGQIVQAGPAETRQVNRRRGPDTNRFEASGIGCLSTAPSGDSTVGNPTPDRPASAGLQRIKPA